MSSFLLFFLTTAKVTHIIDMSKQIISFFSLSITVYYFLQLDMGNTGYFCAKSVKSLGLFLRSWVLVVGKALGRSFSNL